MRILLTIDLSTNCTGWAVFEVDNRNLVSYGYIKGKDFKDSSSQRATLRKLEYMGSQVLNLIHNYKPTYIVIEEIAGSKNRISQKTLDMCHGILWKWIEPYLDNVSYLDVSGLNGWRTLLGLKFSEEDKARNKEAKKINKDLAKGSSKMPIIDQKDLACRHVNKTFNLALDPQANTHDNDVGDAISLGDAWLKFRCPKA